jgi:hypothetical protein
MIDSTVNYPIGVDSTEENQYFRLDGTTPTFDFSSFVENVEDETYECELNF